MLPVTTKFVNSGLLPSSSSEITSLKELLRIVTPADTLEKPSALPLRWPLVPTGAGEPVVLERHARDRAAVGLEEDVVDRVAVELRVAHGDVRAGEDRQALDVAGAEVVGLDVVDRDAVDKDLVGVRPT